MVFKNLNLYKVFFLGVFLLTPWLLSAQQLFQKQLVFEHYTKNQGLSSNQVQEFCQDSEGFIWVATTVGLNKFDGYGFETFEHRTNDSLSLASNWVNSLKESLDRKSLWIATDNGLDKFDKKTEIFEKTNVRSEVFDFFFDKENNLWVASTQGLYKKDYLGKEFKKIADGRFHEIFIDSRDNIWVNKEFSFGTFDLENGLVDTFLRQVDVRTVIEDSQGKIWAGTKELGLVRIENNHTREIKEYSQQNGYFATSSISDIIEESKGKFIVAVRDGGLYYLDTEKDTATGFFMDKFNPKGLNSNALVSMFNDKWGNLWLGTYDKGINFLDMNRKPFLHYNMNFKEDGLPSNSVRSIHQDKTGEIWIGTKEGGCLSRFDYEKGTFQHYCHDENDPESVSGEFILCIENAVDPDYIWVGTYSSGLNYFNKKTGKSKYYRHLPGDKGSLNQDRVYVLYLDSKKQLWIGPREGPLQMLKNPEDDFISYVPKSKANLKAPHNEIRAFFEDSQHAYWIGTNYGLSN
ncbi:ligand-binding sensor domain-containing protein, partial [Flexithrix dorotheae]|uniref:ligand-binding sensor domain-containing protein n=1 Tax=Flexithrix dorotheae TaxID=70993 RepID=UPI00037AA58B